MKRRDLEKALEQISFDAESPTLEQYPTDSRTAAELLWSALLKGDLREKLVLDLGCGSGRLACGAALLNARYVVGVDISPVLLKEAIRNASKLGVRHRVDFVLAEVPVLCFKGFDTVVQNPPFGVRRRGMDTVFLRSASQHADVIYSIHKRAPRSKEFLEKTAERLNLKIEGIIPVELRIPHLFEFHKKRYKVVEADIVIFRRKKTCEGQ